MTGCWGDASHESSSSTVRGTRLVALASRAVLRGFGVGSTVSQADDASLAPRESGTATLKIGGCCGGGSHLCENGRLDARSHYHAGCDDGSRGPFTRSFHAGDWADDDDYDFGEDWDGYHDDGEADVLGFIQSVKPTKKPHARHSGDHTQTHWWHRRRQKNGKEGTWKQTAEQAGYWMGLVAVALFILIGWASDAASIDGVEA